MATIITNIAELEAISNNMAGDYELGADIDLSGSDWTPIGMAANFTTTEFTGTFDGKGYKISNLTIHVMNNTQNNTIVGLFAELGDCTISNLVIDNAIISVAGENIHVGILAGRAYYTRPTISNVSVEGEIFVDYPSGTTGYPSAGGFVGCLYGSKTVSVTDCISNVNIILNQPSNDTLYVGGFIGYGKELLLTRCFAFGKIEFISIEDSGVKVSTMQSLCYYTEHINCATAVSIYGATAGTVNSCGKYLTSTQEFTANARRVWSDVYCPYETYPDNKVVSVSQEDFIALTADNASAYNTTDVDFENGKYLKLAIDHEVEFEDPEEPDPEPIAYDLTIGGETFPQVKEVIYNGVRVKNLILYGVNYTF